MASLEITEPLPSCTTCLIESASVLRGSPLDCASLASVTVAAGCLPKCCHLTVTRCRTTAESLLDCANLATLTLADDNMTGTAQGSLELNDLNRLAVIHVGQRACTCVERLELRGCPRGASRLGIPSLREFAVGAGSFANTSMLSLTCGCHQTVSHADLPALASFRVEDKAFSNTSLAVFCTPASLASLTDPLTQLAEFSVGQHCFTNTTLLLPMSTPHASASRAEFPSVTSFLVGDHSFENARLGPFCGSVLEPPDAVPPPAPSAVEPASAITAPEATANATGATGATDTTKPAGTGRLSEEEATAVVSNPLRSLRELRIGEGCFFCTVVLFVHSTPAPRD